MCPLGLFSYLILLQATHLRLVWRGNKEIAGSVAKALAAPSCNLTSLLSKQRKEGPWSLPVFGEPRVPMRDLVSEHMSRKRPENGTRSHV